jgi:phage-related protein
MTVRELVTVLGFELNDAPLKKYDKQIDSTKEKSNALANVAKGINTAYTVAAAAVGAGFALIGKSIVDATIMADKYRTSIGVLMGDQEKANKIISELASSDFSNIYGDEAALSGAQGLMQFGIAGDEAFEVMQRLGDIANGSGAALSSMGLNMGQVFAKGKADAVDLKQFVLQGFDVVGVIAEQTGKSREVIEKAGVSYEQVAGALKVLTSEGGKYYGMMNKVSNTLGGLIGQLRALADSIAMNIGLGVNDKLKDIIRYVLQAGRAIQEDLVNLGIKVFESLIHTIESVIIFFQVLQNRMKKFGGAFTPLKSLFSDVFSFLRSAIQSAIPLLMGLMQLFLLVFKPIQAFVSPVLEALKPVIKDVFGFLAGIIESLLPLVDTLTPIFQQIGTSIASIITTVWNSISPYLGKLGKGLGTLIEQFARKLSKAMPVIKQVGKIIEQAIGFVLLNVIKIVLALWDLFVSAMPTIRRVGSVILSTIGSAVDRIIDRIQQIDFSVAISSIKSLGDTIQRFLNDKFNGTIAIITDVGKSIESLAPILKLIGSIGLGKLGTLLSVIQLLVPQLADGIGGGLGGVFGGLDGIAGKVKAYIPDIIARVQEIGGEVLAGIVPAIDTVIGLVKRIDFRAIISTVQELGGVIAKFIGNALVNLTPTLEHIIELGRSLFAVIMEIGKILVSTFTTAWAQIQPYFPDISDALVLINSIIKKITTTINGMIPIIQGIGGIVKNVISTVLPIIMPVINTIIEKSKYVGDKIHEVITTIIGAVSGIITKIRELTGELVAGGLGEKLAAGVGTAFNLLIGWLLNFAIPLIKEMGAFISDTIEFLWKFKEIIAAIAIAIGVWKVAQLAMNVAQAAFNILATANPIGLIIAAVALLAFGIYELVKHWDDVVKAFEKAGQWLAKLFQKLWNGIVNTAKKIWNGLKSWFNSFIQGVKKLFDSFIQFFKRLWDNIIAVAKSVWEGLKSWFGSFIEGVKAVWNTIVQFFIDLWNGIINTAKTIWNGMSAVWNWVIDAAKNIWNGIAEFFSGLWNSIIDTVKNIWNAIPEFFSKVISNIKNVWQGIVDWFSELWESIKEGPAALMDYIKTTFENTFGWISEKFHAFVDPILETMSGIKEFIGDKIQAAQDVVNKGTEAVGGFIQGAGEKVSGFFQGVGDFFTGGGKETTPVNDLIVTPEGQYSTHPDDYIMAMRNPSSLVDALARFLGQPQPAYAGVMGSGSLVGNALNSAVQQATTYNNSKTSHSLSVKAPINVSVNASGMSPEQAQSAVQYGVQNALKEIINSSRGSIPSPEARRN